MNAFIKTMFGDFNNVATVALILGITAAIELAGDLRMAWLAMPLLILANKSVIARKEALA